MFPLDDTIAAIASAPGGAARGIVRLSGPAVMEVLRPIFVSRKAAEFPHNSKTPWATSGELRGESSRAEAPLTVDLFLWPTARSYTRQPLAELHTFGSPPLWEAALSMVCKHGARLAQPGEFTLRAFLAGRLDLTQAEAVLGVIDAQDRRQFDTALSQLAGGLARPLRALREELLNLLADLEAGLDFVEEDISFVSSDDLQRRLSWASEQLQSLAGQLTVRQQTSDVPRVALVGLPNAGKSSLFNALLGKGASLVSPVAGTTRDYLSARLNLDGFVCELIDTAGINDQQLTNSIDAEARTAAELQKRLADLRIRCVDSAAARKAVLINPIGGDTSELLIVTKCDEQNNRPLFPSVIATSSRTGTGLAALKLAIRDRLLASGGETAVATTAARARDSIELATSAISHAGEIARHRHHEELVAAEIRTALLEVGKVAGVVYTDDLLDRIFSRFCIGK